MVNSVGKKFAEVDRAYLAGLFDADGALMACIEAHSGLLYKFRVRMYVKIAQKNEQFLKDLQQELCWGIVRANRQVYELDIKNQDQIRSFIKLINPYVRMKKKQLDLGLQILASKIACVDDLVRVARLADTLSSYNVRSSGRRKNYTAKIQAHFSSND